MATATPVLEMEFSGVGGGWTAVSADVLTSVRPVEAEYGIRGTGPTDRIASTGTLTFSLDNGPTNSQAKIGLYSPDHANLRSGFALGIRVRLRVTDNATSTIYYKFVGTLISIQPEPGKGGHGPRATHCTAVDWIDEAARSKIRGVVTQLNKRADQLITTLVTSSVTRQPVATSYATGQSTFAYALDNFQAESTTVLQALADVVMSEQGYLFVKGDTATGGVLRFEDRHARPKFGAAAGTFTNTMVQFEALRERDEIVNRFQVVVHPRKVDAAATTVLYEITPTNEIPSIGAGQTIAINGTFRGDTSGRFIRIGGDAIVTPVATTDYTANSASDGSGTDLTSSITMVVTLQSNAALFTMTNTATVTAYITKLQIRGKGVSDTYETMAEVSDSASQTSYGEYAVTIDMPYESNVRLGDEIARWHLIVWKDPLTAPKRLTVYGNKSAALMAQTLAREPGDKITITEATTGVSDDFFIQAVHLTIEPADQVKAAWTLTPSDRQRFWILDQVGASELDQTTILGYA